MNQNCSFVLIGICPPLDEASATERSEGAGDETESAKAKNPNNVVETSLKEGPNAKPDPEELPTPVTSNFLFKTRLTRGPIQ